MLAPPVAHGASPFAAQQHQQCPAPGPASPPAASCSSVGTTAVGAAAHNSASSPASSGCAGAAAMLAGTAPAAPPPQQQQQGHVAAMLADQQQHAAPAPGGAFGGPSREWLYRLVTFPSYFTPCPGCCGGARTPKREQLMTQFDTAYPYRVYCSTCPDYKTRMGSPELLQVRRSAFKDVVKASDLARYGADVAGVQQYTLNGSKVIYLNREQAPEKKGTSTNAAPAACSVDGRAMMDKSSSYCSLKCKMTAEDPGFTAWLDGQDPSVRILAQAAANAPPRPTLASKRAAPSPTSSGSSDEDGSASAGTSTSPAASGVATGASGATSGGTSRPPKCARTLSGGAPGGGGGAAPQHALARAATMPAAAAGAQPSGATRPGGLKRIRISLPGKRGGARGAPGGASAGLLEAGLGGEGRAGWPELDAALSCSAAWDAWGMGEGGLDSPCFSAPQQQPRHQLAGSSAATSASQGGEEQEEDGSMSPALIHAPSAFASSSFDDWWLCGSPVGGAFSCPAGMGALLTPPPEASGEAGARRLLPSLAGPGGAEALLQGSKGVLGAAASSLLARTSSDSTDAEMSTVALGQCC